LPDVAHGSAAQGARTRDAGEVTLDQSNTRTLRPRRCQYPSPPTTPAALARLREDGVRIVMLTGDNRTTAQAVAAKLGIADIEVEVLPEQKNAIVRP